VFNGVYKVAFDYHENAETKARIDAFVASERVNGTMPHVLPAKNAGIWHGDMQVYNDQQEPIGTNHVKINYTPTSLLRARMDVEISGVINKKYSYDRYRNGVRHTFDGPDVFGNAIAYGRPLYTSQHFYGESLKIRGREFLYDDKFSMSAVWHFFASDKSKYMTFGVLAWEEGDVVLGAKY
jgi:hypothetical protein